MKGLENIKFDNLDTSLTTNMISMFSGCSSLTSLDLSSFDTSKVTNMSGMFEYCYKLENLNLSNADFSNVTNYGLMFHAVPSTVNVLVKDSTQGELLISNTVITNTNISYF